MIPEKPTASFKRRRRLLEAKDFKRVFDDNRFRSSNQNLLVLAIKNPPPLTTSSRLGVVVAKKNARRAVDRNRIKRLTREYFRQQIAPFSCPMDFVVLARPGISKLDNREVRTTLKVLFDNVLKKAANEKQSVIVQAHEH